MFLQRDPRRGALPTYNKLYTCLLVGAPLLPSLAKTSILHYATSTVPATMSIHYWPINCRTSSQVGMALSFCALLDRSLRGAPSESVLSACMINGLIDCKLVNSMPSQAMIRYLLHHSPGESHRR